MKRLLLFFFITLFVANTFSQLKWYNYSDTLIKKRVNISSISIGSVWTTGTCSLYSIWYANYPQSSFHFFNDSKEWMQMDKIGHLYTANKLSNCATEIYKWSGMKSKKATIIGSSIGLGFQTTLEIMDGFSKGWGFSWSDMGANTLGTLSFSTQNIIWNEQRFILKFSSHATNYAQLRPNTLGSTFTERLLKDYNGQTYWISFTPFSFIKKSKIPKWICLSLGYSIDQKIIGDNNYYIDPNTMKEYYAKREFLLSLDIDFSKLPIKNKILKKVVNQFNYVKIPFPTLIISNNRIIGQGIYF